MYRYLDRPVALLDERQRFLLAAMRLWVERARAGSCPCRALADGFAARGIDAAAVRDFGMAMAALDRDGLGTFRFGTRCAAMITEDEARLLTLFTTALDGDAGRLRRIAASLVDDEATPRLAVAAEWVALHLASGIAVAHDR